MPVYRLTGPNGEKYNVTAPDGATEAEVFEVFKTNIPDISTVTGEPFPTADQKVAEGKNAIKTTGPIIGDLAFSAFAPELKIASKLPWAARTLKAGANTLIRSGASAAGSGAGSAVSDLITGDGIDTQRAGKEALLGAGGELGTSAVGSILKMGRGLGKGAVNLASDITKVGSGLKSHAFKSLKRTRQKIVNTTTENAVDFVKAMGGVEKSETGMKIGQVLKTKTDWDKIYQDPNRMIKEIEKIDGEQIYLEAAQEHFADLVNKYKSTMSDDKAIKEAINWLGIKPGSREGRLLREFYFDEGVTAKDANYIIKKIWKSHISDPHQTVKWKEMFKDSVVDDLQRISGGKIDFVGALKKSDEIYAKTNKWFRENPSANLITSKMGFGKSDRLYFEEFPERVVDRLLKTSPEQLKNIKTAVLKEPGGKEAWAGLEFNFVKELYSKSMKQAKGTGARELLPADLAMNIYGNEAKIKALNSKLWPALEKEAKQYIEIAKKFEPIDTTSGMDVFSAWGVMSPNSKKMIESFFGYAGDVTKRATKAGVHMAGQRVDFGKAK